MPEHADHPAGPRATPDADAERLLRQDREAAALRANLQRRKQQARARGDAAAPTDAPDDTSNEAATPCP